MIFAKNLLNDKQKGSEILNLFLLYRFSQKLLQNNPTSTENIFSKKCKAFVTRNNNKIKFTVHL